MSRRTRNPFARISNLFKKRSESSPSASNLSNADISPAQPAPTQAQLPTPSPPSSNPPAPAPLIVHSSNHATSSPQSLLPSFGLTPPFTLPSVSRTPMPQFGEATGFAGAHDFKSYNPQFNDFSLAGSGQFSNFHMSLGRSSVVNISTGIDKLLKSSMPDCFYNSAARYPTPRCHFGTREEYITNITGWALGNSNHHEPILWLRGPFGVGKSAIAQSCAEALQLQNKLAASLFFSRSNADRDDPRRVFTSIAYQITTICRPFRDIVDARIRDDPALTMKSLSTQFEELLVHPFRQIDKLRSGMEGRIVVIDGLDECHGSSEQCEIIDIIASSAHNQTTPLPWFITSRPEEPIVRTMGSDTVSPVSFHLELPVSSDIDHEILVYLVDEFAKIRKRHRLPTSWPSEQTLSLLVDRTAGLWIYVTTIIRFIRDKNSFGPEDQLRIVLEFAESVSAKIGADNPLAEMDLFYMFIMRQILQWISATV